MKPVLDHRFDLSVADARAMQERLRGTVEQKDRLGEVRTVAGVDISYDRGSPILFAAVVVLDAESHEVVETAGVTERATFPYVPGYLSFRELPPAVRAFAKLRRAPDLVVCDGQGYAHPRRFGLACHLGVLFDVPSIGCAKTPLIGDFEEPGEKRGAHRRITHERETIGEVLRTRDRVKPVFVSVGHRISLATARRFILGLTPKTRLPETTRAAHGEVNRMRREAGG